MSEASQAKPRVPTPYEALGGEAGLRRLVDAFYDAMESDPAFAELRRIHAPDLAPMRVRLTDFLSGWVGGPAVYAARHPGRPCVMSAHADFPIGQAEAEQWAACMRKAMGVADVPPAWIRPLDEAFSRMCKAMRNA
ncbi:group II truncated hemoglobin [Phenylobacterium sp.]|uniref:group II truncated hemoglobin n=1 Tax=Phenylobacterium sp. TaxID=1871053 RepID=UPI003954C55B